MAETDSHRNLMYALIEALKIRYADDEEVYVSGNLLIFYEEGNKRRHVSPDVFVVKGVPKQERINYLTWEEERGPNVVIELTSSSTKKEDTVKKFALYQDVLKVPEYFLFDPFGDYLKPRFQANRLVAGKYRPMRITNGQATSRELGLILRTVGDKLRLIDPQTGLQLPTPAEAQLKAEAENERLRAELAAIRSQSKSTNGTSHK